MAYTHTVVGIFDSDFDAQDAVESLLDSGINRSDIEIRNQRNVNGPSAEEFRNSGQYEEKQESGLTTFFKTIFGNDDDVDKHSRLAEEGGAVVTVFAGSEEQASRVADILDDKGAVDVDERASRFGGQTYTGAESVSGTSYPAANTGTSDRNDYDSKVFTNNESEYNQTRNADRQTDEDPSERLRREQTSGPGVGANPSGGMRSKSRINQWRGESSASLRDDRDAETKIGW